MVNNYFTNFHAVPCNVRQIMVHFAIRSSAAGSNLTYTKCCPYHTSHVWDPDQRNHPLSPHPPCIMRLTRQRSSEAAAVGPSRNQPRLWKEGYLANRSRPFQPLLQWCCQLLLCQFFKASSSIIVFQKYNLVTCRVQKLH